MLNLHRFVVFIMSLSMLTLAGCGGYVLQGRVVIGHMSHVSISNSAQGEISGEGVGGANIAIYRDPGRLSQKLIATGLSNADGSFAIDLPSFGAGWMEEQWLIQATRSGFQSAESVVTLPLSTRTRPVHIMLMPGRSIPFEQRDDYMRDYERFR